MKFTYRLHAIRRMAEGGITTDEVKQVLSGGETIQEYPDDRPYPSRLVLGWIGSRPLHVVAADNAANDETIVVTAYEPDPLRWDADFRKRSKKS